MKQIASRLCLFLLGSFLVLSCDKGNDPGASVNVDVTFLKVGTKYTLYIDDGVFNKDTIWSEVASQISTDTFLIKNSSETIVTAFTQYWVVKDNNLYTSYRLRDPSTYQIECKFGAPVGTSWDVKKGGTTYKYTIDALNASVTTGDGVVTDAVKIRIKSSGGAEMIQYISPSVGVLGNGSIDEEATSKLVHYKIGSSEPVKKALPPISFGNFSFLAVGKYWEYTESDLIGNEVDVKLSVESKLSSQNIYKVKLNYGGSVSNSYWYEDRGMLMVYEEGESAENADPIYVDESKATLGDGWASTTSSGTFFFYKVSSLSESVYTGDKYGSLTCMGIDVSNGVFSTQVNYWNKNKGNVYVGGWVERTLIDTNVRKDSKAIPFIPVLSL